MSANITPERSENVPDFPENDDEMRDRYEANVTFVDLAQQFIDDHGLRDVWEAYQEEMYLDWFEENYQEEYQYWLEGVSA